MSVTLGGIVIVVSPEFSKAKRLIVVTELGIEIDVIFSQYEKAWPPCNAVVDNHAYFPQ
jgi:hypothetical protein